MGEKIQFKAKIGYLQEENEEYVEPDTVVVYATDNMLAFQRVLDYLNTQANAAKVSFIAIDVSDITIIE